MGRNPSAVVAFLFLCASVLPSWQKEEPVTFKSAAELVLVPAVVTKDHRLVKGLTANDFVLVHEGHREIVSTFEEIDAKAARTESVPPGPETSQNQVATDSHQDIVILLLNFRSAEYRRIRQHLPAVLREFAASQTPVTVLALTSAGLVQVHSFSDGLAPFIKTVEEWSREKPLENVKTYDVPDWTSPDTRRGLLYPLRDELSESQAVEQIVEAFRGIPGRKKLIIMEGGVPDLPNQHSKYFFNPRRRLTPAEYRSFRILKSLADTNFLVYEIHRGSVSVDFYGSTVACGLLPGGLTVLPPAAADANDCYAAPEKCVRRALADAPHYYLLGFYLHGNNRPGMHKLEVRVDRPGVRVRARNGFAIGDATALAKQAPTQQQVREIDRDIITTALMSPLDYTSIPLKLQWRVSPSSGKDTEVELTLTSPPGGIAIEPADMSINLDYLAFVKPVGQAKGQPFPTTLAKKLTAEEQAQLARAGFLYRKQLRLPPGGYEVRVVLRDNVAKKIGSVSALVDLTD